MTFLDPGALWALPLAGFPILLHMVFLRRARRFPFSDLELLREAYLRSLPASRLRQWLLAFLRALALALLCAAFARPVLRPQGSWASGGKEGLDAVLLVDVSWSMGAQDRGKSRLDWARAAGDSFLKLLKPSDRAAVVPFSDGAESPLAWSELPAAAESLTRLRAGWRGTDLGAALREAYAFLGRTPAADKRRRRLILVLSDNSRHLGRTLPAKGLEALPGYDPEVLVLGVGWPAGAVNAGIAEAFPQAQGLGGNPSVAVRLQAFGRAREGSTLESWVRGRRTEERTVRLSEASALQTFDLAPGAEAEVFGRFQLRKDALEADDSWYFAMKARAAPRVLYLYGSPDALEAGHGGFFLRKLLGEGARGAGASAGLPYPLDIADIGRLDRVRLEEYGAVILDDFKRVPAEAAEGLRRFVQRGGGLWVVAGTQAQEGLRELGALLPGRLGSSPSPLPSGALRRENLPASRGGRPFDWKEFEWGNVAVRRRYPMTPGEGSQVWLRDPLGEPLLLSGDFGRGRVLLWASALDVGWSNLALKPVFTALLDTGLCHLTGFGGRSLWRGLRVGEPLERVWGPKESVPARVEVTAPGGGRTSLLVRERRISYPHTRTPGLYFLRSLAGEEGASAEAYAVNADRSGPEGDLRPWEPPWRLLRPQALREDYLSAVYGREARTWALGLALLMLLAESWLASRKVSRPVSGGMESSRVIPRSAALCIALALPAGSAWAQGIPARAPQGDGFVWSQWKHAGTWDPYPGVHREVLSFLGSVTSVLSVEEPRALELRDPKLFSTPMLILSGKGAMPGLDDEELRLLRDYLTSGGFLWVDDASGSRASEFDRWVRRTLQAALPEADLKPLEAGHVLFKTFFLVRRVGGRSAVSGSVEGADWAGKTVAVYTRNDLLGAWAKDPLGRYLHECSPGGEAQRMDARKLTLNILMYALTGTYKADAVHQPFLMEKMRSGAP